MSTPYNRKDHLYNRAKSEGYRSRAAFKLLELQKEHKVFKPSDTVLDLGCWPGGWVQVGLEILGPKGRIVGVDLVECEPFDDPRAQLYVGDVRDLATLLPETQQQFDAVISDMSPKLTGIKEADEAGTIGCAELALYVAAQHLKRNGNFIVKVFKNNDIQGFVKTARPLFNKFSRIELKSTRNTSNEFYLVGTGFKRKIP